MKDCWMLFLAAVLLIVVAWPTLSICSTAINIRSRDKDALMRASSSQAESASVTASGAITSQRSAAESSLGLSSSMIDGLGLHEPLLTDENSRKANDASPSQPQGQSRWSRCCDYGLYSLVRGLLYIKVLKRQQ